MELEELLKIMDRAAANLAKREEVWKRAATLTHPGVEYDDLPRAWTDLSEGLPPIDGRRITGQLPDLNELNHDITEAHFAGIPTGQLDDIAEKPGRDLAGYRYRLNRARRQAAHDRLQELVASVDTALPRLLGVCRATLRRYSLTYACHRSRSMTSLAERLVPDELWELFRRVVPPTEVVRPQGGGRRRAGDREVLTAIVFVATSGCSWRQLPPVFGPVWPTVYRRFAQWSKSRVWSRLHRVVLDELGARGELDWSRRAIGSVSVRALEGGS